MFRKRIMLILLASLLMLTGFLPSAHKHRAYQTDITCPAVATNTERHLGRAGKDLINTITRSLQSSDADYIIYLVKYADSSNTAFGQFVADGLAFAYWSYLVRSGGRWDHKAYVFNTFSEEQDGNIEIIAGVPVSYEAYSNIHFAFVGRTLGFSGWVLQTGAGINHMLDHGIDPRTFGTFFDDRYDNAAIRIGISLYDLCGADFTDGQFMTIYMAYAHALKVCSLDNCDYIAQFAQ